MSLAIICADSAQAIGISDGRAFTIIDGKSQFLRDDVSKILRLASRTAVAATGERCIGLFLALQRFVAAYQGVRLFADLAEFTRGFIEDEAQDPSLAIVLFGWDSRLCQMRIVAGSRSNGAFKLDEILPERDRLPAVVAIGKTGQLNVSPEIFAEADPLAVLRERLDFIQAVDPEVGGSRFEFLIQAPRDVLRTAPDHPGRCWPILNGYEFAAGVPADVEDVMSHVACRLAVRAAEMGVPVENLAHCSEIQAVEAYRAAFGHWPAS